MFLSASGDIKLYFLVTYVRVLKSGVKTEITIILSCADAVVAEVRRDVAWEKKYIKNNNNRIIGLYGLK